MNILLTVKTFAMLGVCKIDIQSLIQNGMSKILRNWCGTDNKIMRNDFESVLSQSSLGNAMEIYSAIEIS